MEKQINKKLTLVPDQASITTVEAMFDELMDEADVPMKIAMKTSIVVDEIYSNIVNYSGATVCEVRAAADETGVELWFEDNGMPYNPLEAKDPDVTSTVENREIGGLGIFITKKMMDRMDYTNADGKNRLYLAKKA